MFRTSKDYKYSQTPDYKKVAEYKLSPNDVIVFEILTNNGFNLINGMSYIQYFTPSYTASNNTFNSSASANLNNPTSPGTTVQLGNSSNSSTASSNSGRPPQYLIDIEGNVKLPIVGQKHVAGLTIRELETMLEESYSEFYNKPFIRASVINRKVIYFTGNTSDAEVIALTDNNTTLLQLIARQGGMSVYGKAKHLKLIRTVNGEREIYHIDLSTINGVNDAHIVLQANDIIYIEPRKRVSNKAMAEFAPILSVFSSSLLILAVLFTLKK